MINLVAPINTLGYGIVGCNVLKHLSQKQKVAFWPIGQISLSSKNDEDVCVNAINNTHKYDKNAPCIRIWHQHDLAQFVGKGKHIGFPIFELNDFNKIERHHLLNVDELFVCSKWAQDIILNVLGDDAPRTHVIPLGVDLSLFKPAKSPHTDTIFFNCGKWEVRKGHDILIEAFKRAFTPNDNVQLWMMCDNPFYNQQETNEWESKYKNTQHYKNGKIKLIHRVASHEEVYNILSQIDCGVFPSRAEGWNLEALETLACGKQLIITNYSAHTEFCNSQNSHLINIQELEPAFDNKWFFGQGDWAKITDDHISQISSLMKSIHVQKQSGADIFNNAGVDTANKFTWENTTKRILDVL